MLADRRALLEYEVKKAHDEAAAMYLSIITSNDDLQNDSYQEIKARIANLQFDLNIVNRLIFKGVV